MQNIFIVPAMQHGCRAKSLYAAIYNAIYNQNHYVELTGAQWDTGLHKYSQSLAPLPPLLWRLILS